MMVESPLAAMGVVVQGSCSALLSLLLLRLAWSGARRDVVRMWAMAWLVQLVAISGSLVHSIGVLTGDPVPGAAVGRFLNFLYVPGTMLFAVLAAAGAFQAACPPVTRLVVRSAAVASLLLGIVATIAGIPALTGSLLIAATLAAFVGAAVVVAQAERRERPRQVPLLAGAMVLFGAVTLFFQLGAWFGRVLWPVDDFVATFGWLAGYGGALASLVLGGALVSLVVDEALRGTGAERREASVDAVAVELPAPGVGSDRETGVAGLPGLDQPAELPEATLVEEPPSALEAATEEQPMRARTATLPLPPLHADGQSAEVLLIDDEAAVRSTLARIFQRGGWPVRDASTGEEALAWLLDVPLDAAPAVILCDYKMPGMGGQDVYTHLARERPELVSRIVFVTGDAMRESAREFIAGTLCPVVEKPFTVGEIARAVEQVLAVPLHRTA